MAFRSPARPLVVCVERKSRLLLATGQDGKTAKTTKRSLKRLLGRLAPKARRSLTFDNGGEFARHHQLGCKTYFCDPHSPWQKGAVEKAVRASTTCLITADHNRYSVDARAAGRMVLVRSHAERIVVLCNNEVVADHPRHFRRGSSSRCWAPYSIRGWPPSRLPVRKRSRRVSPAAM
jgi:hypothetical protein